MEQKLKRLNAEMGCVRKRPSKTRKSSQAVEPPRKKIVLSREEQELNGAPDTDLVQVVVLPSHEIQAAGDPMRELATIQNLIESNKFDQLDLWADVYYAITSLRRLFLHHQELVLERV